VSEYDRQKDLSKEEERDWVLDTHSRLQMEQQTRVTGTCAFGQPIFYLFYFIIQHCMERMEGQLS
jgi:hypothetical protein